MVELQGTQEKMVSMFNHLYLYDVILCFIYS
jgi:hypothetical protein